ncbi:WD40-repeat-containing domain protein [Ganoderma leucocontextum]|nr:WD40-repeat-containing domain protein [Ganoderma leucocontextum]
MTSYDVLAQLQLGHTGGVAAVAFSPSGTYLATGGLDSKVCVWTLSNQKLYHIFGGSEPVLSLAWLPNREDTLICGSQDGAICVLRVSPSISSAQDSLDKRFPVEHLAMRGVHLAAGAQQELTIWKHEKYGQTWRRVIDLPEPPKTSHNERREILVTSIHWTKTRSHRSMLLVTYMHHGVFGLEFDLNVSAQWLYTQTEFLPLP